MELSRLYDVTCQERKPLYYGIVFMWCLAIFCLCTFSQSPVFTSAVKSYRCNGHHKQPTYKITSSNTSYNSSSHSNQTTALCPCAQGYLFDKQIYGETTVTEWQLICGKEIYDVISNSLLYTGFAIGSVIVGPLSDKYGRKFSLITSLIVTAGFLGILAFSQNIITFALLRMVGMIGNMVFAISVFTYCSELSSKEHRSTVEGILLLSSSLSPILTSVTAYTCRHWRCTVAILGSSMAMFIPFAFLIPESPRWLITKHRFFEAKKSIAMVNKKVDEKQWKECIDCENKLLLERDEVHIHYAALDLFRSHFTKLLTIINMAMWFVCSMVFYGLSLNAGKLAGDPYLNYGLFGVVEFAGCVSIMIVCKLSLIKKNVIFVGLLVAGICCLGSITLSQFTDFHLLATVITITGKYFATINFNLLFMFTTEIYPTVMRSTGLGVSSLAGRVGSVVMPFILYTQHHLTWLTMSLFGVLSLLTTLLALTLPYSDKHISLNTLKEAEEYYSKNMVLFKCFSGRSNENKKRESASSTRSFLEKEEVVAL